MAVFLNHSERRVLNYLSECPPCQVVLQEEIAHQLFYTPEWVSCLLKRLEQKGVIRRAQILTRQGRPYIYEVLHVVPDATSRVLD